jgi:hypothetical protein
MKRRSFIKTTSCATVGALIPNSNIIGTEKEQADKTICPAPESSHIRIDGNLMFIETKTLTARLEKGLITSLKCKQTGQEYISQSETNNKRAIQLVYSNGVSNMSNDISENITARQISRNKAEFVFHAWNGDGVLFISTDDSTGDLIIEPSAYSSRPGLLACRWNLVNIKDTLDLVAPFYQGVKLKLHDPLLKNTRWKWPFSWEAGLAILQDEKGGIWIHTQDDKYRFKALQTVLDDPFTLGFDSEASGPIDNNLSAGGVAWRINTYTGDWHVPAEKYRAWYWATYDLPAEERKRPEWLNNVKFAVSWCPGDIRILDALAKKIPPGNVLLHFSNWRTDPYDENYPTFLPSDNAKIFIKKAQQMGFHVMPHFNAIDMDPSHPIFEQVRDFSYRDVESKVLQGWSSYNGKGLGVPESNFTRLINRDKKVMVKIHPGLGMWRSILVENMQKAITDLSLDAAFIDVTLCIWNIHNSIVDATTNTEGMNKLIKYVAGINDGIAVGGEGLNEITAQAQSFAQVHLFKHGGDGYERSGTCDLNNFLFSKLCRSFGYTGLSGRNEKEALRMKVHLNHGAIPTITIGNADEISNPNPAVSEMFKLANSK